MIDLSCNFRTRFLPAALAVLISLLSGLAFGQGRTETIVISGQAAPDGNGTFSSVGRPVLNNAGAMAFYSGLTGTSGGSSDNNGIFRGVGGAISQIARAGQATPNGNGTFSSFSSPLLNDSGATEFSASLTGTSGGALDNSGIFLGSGGAVTQVARKGQAVPDGNGTFGSFANPALNNSGAVAFYSGLTGTSGGVVDNTGIFVGSGGAITQIAREGQTSPDGNGTFLDLNSPNISPVLGVVRK